MSVGASKSDIIGLSELIRKASSKTAVDSSVISDSLTSLRNIARQFSDSVSMAESISKDASKSCIEIFALNDIFSRIWSAGKILADSMAASDLAVPSYIEAVKVTTSFDNILRDKIGVSDISGILSERITVRELADILGDNLVP
jgi:hypothetical protein